MSVATAETVVAADYVGIVSGNDVSDKLARTGWHAEKSAFVNAPLFAELGLNEDLQASLRDSALAALAAPAGAVTGSLGSLGPLGSLAEFLLNYGSSEADDATVALIRLRPG